MLPRLTVTTVQAGVTAAQAGVGPASLLSYQVAEAVAEGELIEVLGDLRQSPMPVHLLFDGRRPSSTARSRFSAAMREARRV